MSCPFPEFKLTLIMKSMKLLKCCHSKVKLLQLVMSEEKKKEPYDLNGLEKFGNCACSRKLHLE